MLHFTGGVLRSIHCFLNSIVPIKIFQKLNSMIGKRLLSTYERKVPGWHISQPNGTAQQVYVTDHQPSAIPLLCLQHHLGHTLIETILQWSLSQPASHCAVWEVEVASQISTVSGFPVNKKKKHCHYSNIKDSTETDFFCAQIISQFLLKHVCSIGAVTMLQATGWLRNCASIPSKATRFVSPVKCPHYLWATPSLLLNGGKLPGMHLTIHCHIT